VGGVVKGGGVWAGVGVGEADEVCVFEELDALDPCDGLGVVAWPTFAIVDGGVDIGFVVESLEIVLACL
jgi:hypothetical protein